MTAQILLDTLPEDGSPIKRQTVLAEVSGRLGRVIEGSELQNWLWSLGAQIEWDGWTDEVRRRTSTSLPDPINCEKDLEPWFERYLYRQGADEFFEPKPPSINLVVQNTARIGREKGKYTRPDVCMACVSRYHYIPDISFDLFCFELKLSEGFSIPAVMQALSNAAHVHFVYLVVYQPELSGTSRYISAIKTRAVQHGVGLVFIENQKDDNAYKVVLPARRQSPLPGNVESFIESRFDHTNRLALREWVRS